jgi:NADH-quinone oxidoreductase subunit M
MLEYILFGPFIFALIILLIPKEKFKIIIPVSAFLSLFHFIVSLYLFFNFDETNRGFQFVINKKWLNPGINFHIGIDGVSLLLILLTTFLFPISFFTSFKSINKKPKGFAISMFLLEGGIIGVFVSLNLLLFYIFWEIMLIPMYFIIGIWGSKNRIYASFKFVLYTMAGSLLMLLAIIFYFKSAGGVSFELTDWLTKGPLPFHIQGWLFLAFALAFMIKIPLFPFHTWLSDAHTEAPTAGSIILAGVLLKMGIYGFIRFALPLFPYVLLQYQNILIILSIIGIIYGGFMAIAQKDMKRLVAYSSVSHMGIIMLGFLVLNKEGFMGAIYQMLNHGLSTGALFLLVGILYERTHTRQIDDYGGVAKLMPVYSAFFMIIMFSSAGLPGLNGFIGEFMILWGTFEFKKILAVFAGTGIIIGAAYLLWMYRRVMQGPVKETLKNRLADLNIREILILIPIIILIIWMGVYPSTFIKKISVPISIQKYIMTIKGDR